LINGSLDIQTSLTLPIGNISTLIGSNQLSINGIQNTLSEIEEETSNNTINIAENDNDISDLQGRLNIEEPKTSALQILTSSHSTQISLNDTNINVLQGTLDTEEIKIIDLQGRLYIEEPKTSALQILTSSHSTQISLNDTKINVLQGTLDTEEIKIIDLQTLTAIHTTDIATNTANILTKQPTITTSTSLLLDILTTKNLYIGENTGDATTKSIFFGGTISDNNYVLTVIENIIYEANEKAELLLFKGNDLEGNSGADRIRLRAANIVFDTYPIASTNRTAESIRMTILSNGNVGIGTPTPNAILDVNGDVLVAGDLTAENLIVGSTNVITELTSLDSRFDTKQATITSSTDLTCNSITTEETSTSKICGYNFTKVSSVSRMLGGTQT
jgi:hypothetical protein